jgi:type II secretory pathway pseudopilin PulG
MKRPARGFSLVELGVALAVLMAAIVLAASAFAQAAAQARIHQRRVLAREAVVLGLERLRALDASALPAPGQTTDFGLPPGLPQRLPGATCALTLALLPGEPSLWRARLEVRVPGCSEVESGEALLRAPSAGGARP